MNEEGDVFDQDGYPAVTTAGPGKRIVQRSLWALTAVFGLAAWVVGLVAQETPGFAVPLAVLAAAVAAVGLVPGQVMRGWLVVAVAVTAFTAATTMTVVVGHAGRGSIGVDVLLGLQVVVAVAALLLEPRIGEATQAASEGDYAAYVEYARAYREYAQQYESHWPEHYSTAATAETTGEAQGTVAGDQDAWADLQARYAQHVSPVVPLRSEHTTPRADGGDTVGAGMPGADWAERYPTVGERDSTGTAAMTPPEAY
ncbi:hypothetical protein CIW49_18245 [Mycolicibacterium sp. P1-18]|uniref:DUF5336 domain-containing protein n=1 Tax=Mycolicibacterium sp. P1-18 TaxID=2024615 RepID=UPI0011F22BBA|nr:DUF5336 domain-containing protein [Mycolicibacterium sp. P1-18]KAA0096621.1 hypothetical protein CIW49_18245 [Mycolicibacterium sp. P1-18]